MTAKEENKKMYFFEINAPYFAVIAAQEKERCLEIYTTVVSNVDDEESFYVDLKTIEDYEALKILVESYKNAGNPIGLAKACEQIENVSEQGELLVVSGSLL